MREAVGFTQQGGAIDLKGNAMLTWDYRRWTAGWVAAHPKLKLERGDTVVFSSRVIPGNDRAVIDLMGKLLRSGIRVVGRANDPLIHASGHAHREELVAAPPEGARDRVVDEQNARL